MAVIETVHGQVENDDKASVNNANRLTLDRYPPTMLAHVLILTDSRLHHFKRNLLIISRNMLLYIAIYITVIHLRPNGKVQHLGQSMPTQKNSLYHY